MQRDRLTVYFRDPGVNELSVVATRAGGKVEAKPPGRGDDFFVLEELSASKDPEKMVLRELRVHKDTVRAIVQDQAPAEKRVKAK